MTAARMEPKQARKGMEMAVQDIANKFGLSRKAIYNLEQRALRKIRAEIKREAQAAGVSVREWLFGE